MDCPDEIHGGCQGVVDEHGQRDERGTASQTTHDTASIVSVIEWLCISSVLQCGAAIYLKGCANYGSVIHLDDAEGNLIFR